MQRPTQKNDDADDEDEDEEEDGFVEEDQHGGKCHICEEHIWSFHLSYYHCYFCDYSLHKLCAELPQTLQNHPLHPSHDLVCRTPGHFKCFVCNLEWNEGFFYFCCECYICMDVICATLAEQTINHPNHPHRLERMPGPIVSSCVACGNKHDGIFFLCTTCPRFRINRDCALLPTKILIQNHTNKTFIHSHPLTLAYSFPISDQKANFKPNCRVCDGVFYSHLWIYECKKCIYYAHVDCATSNNKEAFMSIFLPSRLGKTYKNYKEDEYPKLLHCPFQDEGDNLLKRYMSNQKEVTSKEHDGEMLNYSSHQHPLVLFNNIQTSVDRNLVSLHDPMKGVQLLCDGCIRPIMTVPFYICNQYADERCCFVLHEWCANLPSKLQDYVDHPEHTLFLVPKVHRKLFGVFECAICQLPSNCFAYVCTTCEYYVDINCAFLTEEITHEAHPNHLLSIVKLSTMKWKRQSCKACLWDLRYEPESSLGFSCSSCDFYIHVGCALLLPKVVKHKCDKHPLSLRYNPVENHISKYFCEICEDELNPWGWFYHCTTCAQSMHGACVPVKLQYEQAPSADMFKGTYMFLNVKFGGTLEIKRHSHRLSFVQGLESDGRCFKCERWLEYKMIFKCLECKFAFDYECASLFVN